MSSLEIRGLRIPSAHLNDKNKIRYAEVVSLRYSFDTNRQRGLVFQLDSGPTGFESFYVDDFLKRIQSAYDFAWCACAGTHNRWDELWIPASEMRRALKDYI